MQFKKYHLGFTALIISITLLLISFASISGCTTDDDMPKQEPVSSVQSLQDYKPYLVSNYLFNNNLLDISMSGVTLDSIGGGSFGNDRNSVKNQSYFLNGQNQHLELPDSNHVKLNFPFTVSLWAFLNDNASYSNRLFNSDNSSTYYGYGIACGWPNNVGKVIVSISDGTGSNVNARKTFYGTTVLNATEWNHIAVVFNSATQILLYINGAEEVTTTDGAATSMMYSNSPTTIGRLLTSYLNGSVDNLKIWSKSLPGNVILEEYQSTN